MTDTPQRNWVIVPYGDGDSLTIHSGPDERVCFMATPGDSPGALARILENANLICAAPALLKAAQRLSALAEQIWVKMSDGEMAAMREGWAEMDAAIAKALAPTE